MDPDGDYESRHSARSIGDVLPTGAKVDDLAEGSKKSGDDGFDNRKGGDEEMGLKPSPIANPSKVVFMEEKAGSVNLKPSAPPLDEECQPSAPPLEPSLHPSPEDAAATCTPSADNNTSECNGPPEPPGFKNDPIERSNVILDSVALPIGLDCADRGLPVASAVPIITNATGGEVVPPTTQAAGTSSATEESTAGATSHQSTTSRSTRNARSTHTRRVPLFFRQSSTHPAPEQPVAVRSATASLADPQSSREERGKRESRGCKCTPCKKAMCIAAVVVLAIVITVMCLVLIHPDYPECRFHISERHYLGNGWCDGRYNTLECGWDGGDCVVQGYPDCHVDYPNEVNDGYCGRYNTAECGWDGGDCIVQGYPECHVDSPHWVNDGYCKNSGNYNSAACGWDGGDCLFNRNDGKACQGSVRSTWTDKTRAWCQYKCMDEGNSCKAYDYSNGKCRIFSSYLFSTNKNNSKCWTKKDVDDDDVDGHPNCHVANPGRIGDGDCDGGQYNTLECGWDGGDCLVEGWPNCRVQDITALGNGACDEEYNNVDCGFDLGDCRPSLDITKLKEVVKYPGCFFDGMELNLFANGRCTKIHNTAECGWDGGDCADFNRRYPGCNVNYPYSVGNGKCSDSNNNAACGYDGGDCLFYRNDGKKCQGSARSTWTNKTRAWCQYKCMDEGNSCKAYDFSWASSSSYDGQGTCRIFRFFNSNTGKNNSRCYKKK